MFYIYIKQNHFLKNPKQQLKYYLFVFPLATVITSSTRSLSTFGTPVLKASLWRNASSDHMGAFCSAVLTKEPLNNVLTSGNGLTRLVIPFCTPRGALQYVLFHLVRVVLLHRVVFVFW